MNTEIQSPLDMPDDPSISWNPSSFVSRTGETGRVFVDPFGETSTCIAGAARPDGSVSAFETGSAPFAYRLQHKIAEGGQGEVWRAIQVSLSRTVAVKRVRRSIYRETNQTTARLLENSFYREALVTGRLEHPAIVPVYDLGMDAKGSPLLAMKLVEGTQWGVLIRHTRQTLDPAAFLARHIPILISVCHAVAFAHSRGVVHRDLKPSQVMVGDYGEVFLMDWGLAVVVDPQAAEDEPSAIPGVRRGTGVPNPAGTICFMAPEQTEPGGARIGPWTDVFLLGATLYYLLTGTPLWPQSDSRAAFEAARTEAAEPPERRAPDAYLPPDLTALCMRALSREIEERPRSVEEFRIGLEEYLNGASRRREARQILDEVQKAAGAWPSTYPELSHLDRELARARALWPDEPQGVELACELARHYCATALARGDLSLARMQAGRLLDTEERARRIEEIDQETRRLRRLARQRRAALGACFALIVAAGMLTAFFIHHQAEAQAEENRLAAQARQSDAKATHAAVEEFEARRRAEVLRALKDLNTTESVLARDFEQVWGEETPVPPVLVRTPYEEEVWEDRGPERILELLNAFQGARAERARLAAAGLPTGPVPYSLLFGAATTLLYAPDQTRLREAYDLYSEAASGHPDRYRAQIGMAAAAVRLGELTSATRILESAARNAGEASGFRGDFGRIRALESEVDRLRWARFSLPAGAVLIEPRPGGNRFGQYEEVSGNWDVSDKPANWAKSSAPGTTPLPGWGSRKLHFFSAFTDVKPTLPAAARYYPRPERTARYHVYVTWPRAANAEPVRYVIRHRAGETVLPVVQDGWGFRSDPNSNRWVALGEYEFDPGDSHFLEVRVEDDVRPFTLLWNGQVQADAVLFSPEPLTEGVLAPRFYEPRPGIAWLTDFEKAREESLRTGRPIFVFSAPPGHPQTHYLDGHVFSDPAVCDTMSARCVPLRIITGGNTATSWKLRHVDNGWTWLCDAEGKALRRMTLQESVSTPTLCAILREENR